MPAIGPVYQPTTYNVGYESQNEWPQPPRRNRMTIFVDWMQSEECCRKCFISSIVIIVLFIFYVLLEWIANVFFDYPRFSNSSTVASTIIFYILFIIFALACFVLLLISYFRFITNKRFYFWPFVRKEGLSRQLNGQGRNGQALVLNPSTDLLVTPAQYGPVIEPPPTMLEEDETRNLMGNENKEIGDEAEEKSQELDPRIVLRPPGRRDDA